MKKSLTKEESAVLHLIKSNHRITQREIAKNAKFLGCLKAYEGRHLQRPQETTLRKVRSIIRTLRVKHHQPILSNYDGYWICKSEKEAKEYLETRYKETRAQVIAWRSTLKAMQQIFNLKNQYNIFV